MTTKIGRAAWQMWGRCNEMGRTLGDVDRPGFVEQLMQSHSTINSTDEPYRGPSGYQSRSQYYEVLNHFFSDGVRVRRYARFKRIGDKRGWGAPEWKEGLELDRQFFFDLDLTQAAARISELVKDGCEFVSYKKHPAPGEKVTYVLVSWPANQELERNRAARVLRKSPKQTAFPRSATPFQHSNPRIEAAPVSSFSAAKSPKPQSAIPESPDWYEREHGPRPSGHPWKSAFSEKRLAQEDCFQLTPPQVRR